MIDDAVRDKRFVEQRRRILDDADANGVSIADAIERLDAAYPDPASARWPADLATPGRSWTPVDVESVLDGTYTPPVPTVGARSDGARMFYLKHVHEIASEPEVGKSWLVLLTSKQEIAAGHRVVYMDFEDDAGGIVGRLVAMGADHDDIRQNFAYVQPTAPILADHNDDDLHDLLTLRPTLVIIDGVTEAMALHGLELTDNSDVARFDRLLARDIADRGPAVVKLDHVTKDREGRGRFSIGGQHKLAGLNGAAYRLENRTPFGIGRTGRSGVFVAKDRPGGVRRHSLPSAGGLDWFADLSVESLLETAVEVALLPPEAQRADNFRPTVLMRRVSEALSNAGRPMTLREILDRVAGKRSQDVRTAVARLVDEGNIVIDNGPRGAHLHRLVKPFGDNEC